MKDSVAWPDRPDGNVPYVSDQENLDATLTVLHNSENPQEAVRFIHMLGLDAFQARATLQERKDNG